MVWSWSNFPCGKMLQGVVTPWTEISINNPYLFYATPMGHDPLYGGQYFNGLWFGRWVFYSAARCCKGSWPLGQKYQINNPYLFYTTPMGHDPLYGGQYFNGLWSGRWVIYSAARCSRGRDPLDRNINKQSVFILHNSNGSWPIARWSIFQRPTVWSLSNLQCCKMLKMLQGVVTPWTEISITSRIYFTQLQWVMTHCTVVNISTAYGLVDE